MAHSGDGTGWDGTVPANSEPVYKGALEIRDLRLGTAVRADKEHVAAAASSVGGEHKQGSAKAYSQSASPTNRPDGSTALTADDDGRLWVDEDTDWFYVLTAGGTPTWTSIGTMLGMTWSNSGADPAVTQVNTDAEDTDESRQTLYTWKGTQSGSEETTLATMKVCHDGAADDQKGQIIWAVNDGDDNNTPSKKMTLGATGLLTCVAGIAAGGKVTGITDGTADGEALDAAQVDGTSIQLDGSNKLEVVGDPGTWTPGAADNSITIGKLIIKCGYIARGSASQQVTFAAAFPNGLLSVVATKANDTAITNSHSIDAEDVNGFKIETASSCDGFYWIAMGY